MSHSKFTLGLESARCPMWGYKGHLGHSNSGWQEHHVCYEVLCVKNSWSCANTGSIKSFFRQHIPTCLCLISSISLATSLAFQGTQVLRKTLLDAFICTEVCVFYSLPSILATRTKQAGEMGSLQRVWNPQDPSIWVAFNVQRRGGTKHVIRQGLLLRVKVQITHLGPSNSQPPPTRAPSTPWLQTKTRLVLHSESIPNTNVPVIWVG